MKVLSSSKAFREHYVARTGSIGEVVTAFVKGGAISSGVAGTSALAVGTTIAHTSAWTLASGLPWIGGLAASKATAAGIAAGIAAAGSAPVLVPAICIGGSLAYIAYRNRKKPTLHKGSDIGELANAFACVACLPMLALAVSVCQANPSNRSCVLDFILKEMESWGYSENYIRASFEEAMSHSPQELEGKYQWAIQQLSAGSTEGIGATPEELPGNMVQGYADDFKRAFKACLG
ncbi:MAG: hypothetical protein Q4G65_08415 [bacterium]|nr:hypothetical protein [bacterium]